MQPHREFAVNAPSSTKKLCLLACRPVVPNQWVATRNGIVGYGTLKESLVPVVLDTGPLVVPVCALYSSVSLFIEPFHSDCFVVQHYCIRI